MSEAPTAPRPANPGFSGRTILWASLLIALILAVAKMLVVTVSILLLVLAGVLLGIFLNALSTWLCRKSGLRYLWSYIIVLVALVALTVGGYVYLHAQVVAHAAELWDQLQESGQEVYQRVRSSPWVQRFMPEVTKAENLMPGTDTMLPAVTSGLQWLLWGLTGAVVILVVGLYVAYDSKLYEEGIIKLVPPHRRDRAREVMHTLRVALGKWIAGRLMSMAMVGAFTAVGLWLLGVPMPITLGVVAALLSFVPNVGPLMAIIPQSLLAMKVGTDTVLYVILFNIGMQTVESYLLTPIVQQYEVSLPPVMTIVAQLLLGVLFGVMGVMMAAPLAVTVIVLVQMLYVQDRLGDTDTQTLAETSH